MLSKVKSVDKLRPEDFGKKKPELNLNLNQFNEAAEKMYDGMLSPRAVFNEDTGREGKLGGTDIKTEHKIFIVAYLDYSKKYGLGYVINNRYYGVYFNDETLMSCD